MSAASDSEAEWARSVEKRLRRLERRLSWDIDEDDQGRLVARKNGATVVLAALPDAEGIEVVRYG